MKFFYVRETPEGTSVRIWSSGPKYPEWGLTLNMQVCYVPLVSLQTPQLNVLAATIWILLMSALLILISCFSSSVASSFGISVFYPLIWGDLKKDGRAYLWFFLIGSATCFFSC